MSKLYIGKVVNTHGIKGEIRIKTNLKTSQKKEVFKLESHLIIDNVSYKIKSYRLHKDYDMVTFEGFNNINEVLMLKGRSVYKDSLELNLQNNDILDSELITYKVVTNTHEDGIIKEIEVMGNNYKILRCLINEREVLIPYHDNFVKINKDKREVLVTLI